MTNNTQFTRQDVEEHLKRTGDSYYAQGLLKDGQAMLQALLTDMDAAVEALDWLLHETMHKDHPKASENASMVLKQCAKWRVV